MSETIKDQESIIENIMHYLELNPNAADTLEGVVKWWLPNEFKNTPIDIVQEGLELMIKQSVVKKTKSLDGNDVYSRGS